MSKSAMDASIDRMTGEIAGILDQKVHSVWLYGSVALDDFQLGWSDIDVLILAKDGITESQARELLTLRQALMEKEPGNPYYRAFEGIIASVDEYRAGAFTRLVYWGTTGQRVTDRYAPDAFARYELAKFGRCVYGATDRSLFTVPGWDEMTAAIRNHCAAIRQCAARTDESLYSCGWLLDIARCVYTLRYHDVIAKTQAGAWALATRLFPEDEALRKTLAIRRHPLAFKDRDDVKQWLAGLGPVIQRYADVLARELGDG